MSKILEIINNPEKINKFSGIKKNKKREFKSSKKPVITKVYATIAEAIQSCNIKDGDVISFHHHLRNGDYVLRLVMEEIAKLGVKDLTISASAIFPTHECLVPMIEQGIVTSIIAAYISGPVANAISLGKMKKVAYMHSHGARARMIEENELNIDHAFIAAPTIDVENNISGVEGPAACGVIAYPVADSQCAKNVIAISDNVIPDISKFVDIKGTLINGLVKIDKIGDPAGIVSGTTQVTKDPIGLKIASNTMKLITNSGLFKDGLTFQTGAGGISLAVAVEMKKAMKKKSIKGKFALGGITQYIVDMLEEGLFSELLDTQCFDLGAVKSLAVNKNHKRISSSMYSNPLNPDAAVDKLDFVVLGATEIDIDFNVNVLTGSDGIIIGGSGGHADTAAGAKFAIIVSKLFDSRISVIKDRVTCITTPGETIDILVTEYGIAINPKHKDLIKILKKETNLEIKTMAELKSIAENLCGIAKPIEFSDKIVAISEYRDGTAIDMLKKVK